MSRSKGLIFAFFATTAFLLFQNFSSSSLTPSIPDKIGVRDSERSNPITDFMIPNVCVDSNDQPIPGDPYECAHQRDLKVGEEVPYIRTQVKFHVKVNGPGDYQVTPDLTSTGTIAIMYPIADRYLQRGAVTLDDSMPVTMCIDAAGNAVVGDGDCSQAGHRKAKVTGAFDADPSNIYGVNMWADADTQYFAAAETTSSLGPNGWFTGACEAKGGWAFFEKSFLPFTNSEEEGIYQVSGVKKTLYTDVVPANQYDFFFLPPLKRGSDFSLYRGSTKLCDASSTGTSHIGSQRSDKSYTFEGLDSSGKHKVMPALIERSYYGDPRKAGRLGMELDVFTKEYGRTRWENWKDETLLRAECTTDNKNDAVAADKCAVDQMQYALAGAQCPNTGARTQMMFGMKAYRVICSDRTKVTPITASNPWIQIPLQPRVSHLSREIFGANQNWIAYPDFSGGAEKDYQKESRTAWYGISEKLISYARDAYTNNASLQVECTAEKACTLASIRSIFGGAEGDQTNHTSLPIMTAEEFAELIWLDGLEAGATIRNVGAGPLTAQMEVNFLKAGNVVKTFHGSLGLKAQQADRLRMKGLSFNYADLGGVDKMQVHIILPAGAKVQVDDIYVFPRN